jgi:hypothetical protein
MSTRLPGLYRFEPNPSRSASLDARVRAELAGSLETIFGTIDEIRIDSDAAKSLIRTVHDHRIRPGIFGLYTDLVEALFADDVERAQALVDALLDRKHWRSRTFQTVTLDDADLGPGQAERYRRMVDDDGLGYVLEPISFDLRRHAESLLDSTMQLMDQATPQLAGEIRALTHEIVFVQSQSTSFAGAFGGASTFYLWGAMFLNATRYTDRLSLATALAHESGHSYLFGVTLGDKLVENKEDELYPSPLRQDLRPMDGVVHATYVLARMAYCLRALLASGSLNSTEAEEAASLLENYSEGYWAGSRTVLPHAQFSPEAATVFQNAHAYMEANAEIGHGTR